METSTQRSKDDNDSIERDEIKSRWIDESYDTG